MRGPAAVRARPLLAQQEIRPAILAPEREQVLQCAVRPTVGARPVLLAPVQDAVRLPKAPVHAGHPLPPAPVHAGRPARRAAPRPLTRAARSRVRLEAHPAPPLASAAAS